MTKEEVVNLILRDMVLAGFVVDGKREHVKFHLELAWTAGYENYRQHGIAHNRKRVEQFTSNGKKIADFDSIEDAARANKCRRNVVDESIHERTGLTRNGHYFRYADNGKE